MLLFPITLIGYVIWLARIYMGRRASGASISAQGPLSARSVMHTLGLRRDEAAYRLWLISRRDLPGRDEHRRSRIQPAGRFTVSTCSYRKGGSELRQNERRRVEGRLRRTAIRIREA